MRSTTSVLAVGALLCGSVLLTACGAPPPVPVPPPPTSTVVDDPCPEPGVAITAGEVDSALGLRALGIVLTNCGTRDHTVHGYPAVRVLDADRQPLEVIVGNGSPPVSSPDSYDAPPQPVTLRPGERATARLLWRNTVTDSTVNATVGEYLEIAPAAGQPTQTVTPPGGIDLGNTGRLAVNAWAVRP
ncbi:DUF4232 domain-containing protein [Actinokineospora sp. G85]|uniref:DUF4232 domain-containing protein n=1 Tax=Actinokineospora sp. G85 TaxID=3406626 RepID=UPI003C736E68